MYYQTEKSTAAVWRNCVRRYYHEVNCVPGWCNTFVISQVWFICWTCVLQNDI